MSDKTLRDIIASVIALLLISQIGTLIAGLFGIIWAVLSAVAVIAVWFFWVRLTKIGGENSFWFFLLTILFTVFPIVFVFMNIMREDINEFDRMVRLAPFIIGFGAPLVLLLIVYYELRKRTLNGPLKKGTLTDR